eukprot:1316-Heterococcus_DN1.PRE.1
MCDERACSSQLLHYNAVQQVDSDSSASSSGRSIEEAAKLSQPLLFVLEHTTLPIISVACSSEEPLAVTADASGVCDECSSCCNCISHRDHNACARYTAWLAEQTRMYRPQVPDEEESTEVPQTAEAVAAALRWRTVAECQLGATPVACTFSPQPAVAASVGDYDDTQQQQQQQQQYSEQLLTCSAAGLIRVWPTAALPLEPPLPSPTADTITSAAAATSSEHTATSAAADSSAGQQASLSDEAAAEARQGDAPLP